MSPLEAGTHNIHGCLPAVLFVDVWRYCSYFSTLFLRKALFFFESSLNVRSGNAAKRLENPIEISAWTSSKIGRFCKLLRRIPPCVWHPKISWMRSFETTSPILRSCSNILCSALPGLNSSPERCAASRRGQWPTARMIWRHPTTRRGRGWPRAGPRARRPHDRLRRRREHETGLRDQGR